MRLALKSYQRTTLQKLGDYCAAVRAEALAGARRPERDAFERETDGRIYYSPPGFEGTPYICLRLPTGGGKTLLAAHSVATIAKKLLADDYPACLWITPGTTIRDQTLKGLTTRDHPYHLALRESLGGDIEVMTLEDALARGNVLRTRSPVIIVTTIQSYRLRDERSGEELEATRRIYRDSGYLQDMFEGLPASTTARLSKDEKGLVYYSLANALMLRRPVVIMDEAHNARTATSFDSLARFGPSLVLELTATPQQEHDPANERYASNVLHAVSALELKSEHMIKLPVELASREEWLDVLAATVQRRRELETVAASYSEETGHPPIRPIALIQAQAQSRTRETQTPDVIKRALLERLHVPPEEIRICTGSLDEIGDEDLMSPDSRVCYVITVDKLREGWDCPFAYVLGSIGNAATATAVEQLLGRVLRMPYAIETGLPALDRAYAFVLSRDVAQTAMELRDRLVQSCGFDRGSAADALRVSATMPQGQIAFGGIPLSAAPPTDKLPDTLRGRTTYNQQTQTLEVAGSLSQREATALRQLVTSDADRQAIEEYWQRERPPGTAPKRLGQYAPPVRVPRLTVLVGASRTLFEPEELDTFSWNLDECDYVVTREHFADEVRVGQRASVDVSATGSIVSMSPEDVLLRQLELVGEGDDWQPVELARWLDSELHRGGAFAGLSKAESQPWLMRAVEHLTKKRGLSLPVVVRRRHALADLLRGRIAEHFRRQARRAAEQLIELAPTAIETSPEMMFEIQESEYAPYHQFANHHFRKHAFELVSSLNTEEAECATQIDNDARVARWLRNLDRESQRGFYLPKSPGKFFPDFIVERTDGVIALVEYKMRKLASDPEELHKRAVGNLWAGRSNGSGRFAWVVERDWAELDRQLSV